MALTISTILVFIIALIISTLVIYVVTKLFGQTEDIKTALIAALIGSVIYAVIYFILGHGLIAAVIGGIAWLITLRMLYKIGWLKSLVIAVVIWILTSIVGWILPTLTGPI
jgi:4-amino-4-deoxy-L-arabinose transferase-like glycosyltransferase